MSQILITGAAGFLGSHLTERLLKQGHHVTGVDNLLTSHVSNLKEVQDNPRFTFIRGDAATPPDKMDTIDEIYHLASPASPPDYLRYPFASLHAGATATSRLLEVARSHGARFLLASTSEVYGDPLMSPQDESYWGNVNPVGPRAVYDEAKRFAEAATSSAARTWGLEVRIARIFNTYGPRMRPNDGRVVSNFIQQAITGHPLTVYGDGDQTRSFCYASDLVEGLHRLMKDGDHNPTNLGNPDEHSVMDLARLVRRLTGARVPIHHRPIPEDDPRQRRPDITRAMEHLDWEPRVPLEDGLRRTIRWFRAKERSRRAKAEVTASRTS